MTVGAWITFMVIIFFCVSVCFSVLKGFQSTSFKVITVVVAILIIAGVFFGFTWFFGNTATGQRMLVDQKSELNNGIERTLTVYTADGEVLARYEGKIDIESNDGGYVKFDFEGNRYIYYNCFVETIAKIG